VLDKDPKALSGGEKSYATICLLLALWESMASPFRALDEFDVYMDAANRHLAMKLIVDHARDSANSSQYILISPQGASQKDLTGPDIRILKMREPERGQTRINFPTVSK
jgi:chromosome segregation ATPase